MGLFGIIILIVGIVLIIRGYIWFGIIAIIFALMIKVFNSPVITWINIHAAYSELKRKNPKEPGVAILCEVLKSRYPEWDDKTIEDVVKENSDIHSLTKFVIQFERGAIKR